MRKKVIIDTDPGVDDAMAIQLALHSKELDILGLTTVFGNVSVDLATTNALRLVDLAGQPELPVIKGAADPLNGQFGGGVPFVHGDDGQGNVWAEESNLQALKMPAHEFIIDKILEFPNEVTLIPVGPLTNLALAIQVNPEIVALTREVIVMGGNAFCSGNATPAAEANILSDPEAADLVFGADWPVTMIGLDITHQVLMNDAVLSRIAKIPGKLNQHVSTAHQFYRDFFAKANKIEGIYVHDSTALMYALRPEFFETAAYPVRVETSDTISRGKTWPALGDTDQETQHGLLPWRGRPKINVGIGVDAEAVIAEILHRLEANPA